jgi:polycomb protein SUZ12
MSLVSGDLIFSSTNSSYVGDCQIPLACEKFVEYQGKELIRKNLYRNFILHLTNLFDFGLLSPQALYKTVQLLHTQMKENDTAVTLRDSWRAHV